MLIAHTPREINFLIAAVSTKNKLLKGFLMLLNFIPTPRPQDLASIGQGTITSIEDQTLTGVGTKFTEYKEKYSLFLTNVRSGVTDR